MEEFFIVFCVFIYSVKWGQKATIVNLLTILAGRAIIIMSKTVKTRFESFRGIINFCSSYIGRDGYEATPFLGVGRRNLHDYGNGNWLQT